MGEFISQALGLFATHDWVGLFGLLMAVFVTLLTSRAKFCPSWDSPWRTFLGTLCGAAGMALNQVQHGNTPAAITMGIVQTSVPTLLAELVAAVHAGRGGGAQGGTVVPLPKPSPQPGPYGAALVGLAMGALLLVAGCGGAVQKPLEVKAIRMSREECQSRALVIVASAKTCLQAQVGLAELVDRDDACKVVLGTGDFGQMCAAGVQ